MNPDDSKPEDVEEKNTVTDQDPEQAPQPEPLDEKRIEELEEEFYNDLASVLKYHEIGTAILIADHPHSDHKHVNGSPLVYMNGHFYDTAKLVSRMHRMMQKKIEMDMNN